MPRKQYYRPKTTGDTGIDLKGLDELQEAFQQMYDSFPNEKLQLMNDVGDTLVEHIKPLTPINYDPPDDYEHTPGRLRESIRKKIKENYAVVKSGERYAHLIEAGHVIANRKVESAKTYKKGSKKGQYKMRADVKGFVKGYWMFKKGTAMATFQINRLVDEFAKKVTYNK